MTVRFSCRCPNADYLGFEATPEGIIAAAVKAEELGFNAVFVDDHIVLDNTPRSAPWTNTYDPFVALSFIAANTTRIDVGISVLIVSYRHPIATAKMLATLDHMSSGRLIAGVGVGWKEAEFRTVRPVLGVAIASLALAGFMAPGRGAPLAGSSTMTMKQSQNS